jgi:hypothetical protein
MEIFKELDMEKIGIIVGSVIAIASVVASLTPTPKDNKVISFLYKILVDIPALNIGVDL